MAQVKIQAQKAGRTTNIPCDASGVKGRIRQLERDGHTVLNKEQLLKGK